MAVSDRAQDDRHEPLMIVGAVSVAAGGTISVTAARRPTVAGAAVAVSVAGVCVAGGSRSITAGAVAMAVAAVSSVAERAAVAAWAVGDLSVVVTAVSAARRDDSHQGSEKQQLKTTFSA